MGGGNDPAGRVPSVFHLRMGGCGGCIEAVDRLINDPGEGTSLVETASPENADVVLVTGCWSSLMREGALARLQLVPSHARIIAAGNCARGLGSVRVSVADELPGCEEVEGCCVNIGILLERLIRDVGISG